MGFQYSWMRNLRFCFRNKTLTFINIFGLGVGLAITMFLLVYLFFEYSYDRHFKDADRIYRFLTVVEENTKTQYLPNCLGELGKLIKREIPEVEAVGRFYRNGESMAGPGKKERFDFIGGNVDTSFFNIFDFDVVYGSLDGVFREPLQCVLMRSTAEILFGKEINPVGQYVEVGEQWKIMAVIEDLPLASHLKAGYFRPITKEFDEYEGLEFFIYAKFHKSINLKETIDKCNALNTKLLNGNYEGTWTAKFSSILEPLTTLHISTKADFDLTSVNKPSRLFFILLVGILVLGLAISNFISLFMIQGEKRSLEIGIRKTGGASRGKIVAMLLGETFLVTLMAFILALVLYVLFAQALGNLLEIHVPDFSWEKGKIISLFIGLYIVTSLIAGSYPAWNLSRFQPAELIGKTILRKFRLTVTSVVTQFAIVIFCVSALWIVLRQLDYVMKQPFGFETKNMLVYYVGLNHGQAESIEEELAKYPCILSSGVARGTVQDEKSGESLSKIGQNDNIISVDAHDIDKKYLITLEIPLLEGRGFSGNLKEDEDKVILSETALKALGIKDVVGEKILLSGEEVTVIGIAKDCRYGSARSEMGNVIYTSYKNDFRCLYIHFQTGMYQQTCEAVKTVLKKHFPEMTANKSLLENDLRYYYKQDQVVVRMLKMSAGFAILLALLGLGALCGFVAQQKKKEISLRRVAGACTEDIIHLMLCYVVWRVVPAIPLGIIASYFIMERWLRDFKFAITIPWWIYALTITALLVLVVVVVMWKSWKVANTNPAEALKTE